MAKKVQMEDSIELGKDFLDCLDDLDAPKNKKKKRGRRRKRSSIKEARVESPKEILDPQQSKRPVKKFGNYNSRGGSRAPRNQKNHRSVDLSQIQNNDENCVLI